MKSFKTVIKIVILAVFLFGISSCAVTVRKDHGHHYGWFKNTHNPHHPRHHNNGKFSFKYKGESNHNNNGSHNNSNKNHGKSKDDKHFE